VVHPTVERSVNSYLSHLDGLLADVVTGFYLIGSVAPGAYREGGRQEPARLRLSRPARGRLTAAFVVDVVDAAGVLGASP
jgi:hypothetical protein